MGLGKMAVLGALTAALIGMLTLGSMPVASAARTRLPGSMLRLPLTDGSRGELGDRPTALRFKPEECLHLICP